MRTLLLTAVVWALAMVGLTGLPLWARALAGLFAAGIASGAVMFISSVYEEGA